MDHKILVYKINNSVQNSLSSSLVLILIQGPIYWSTLRSLSHNTKRRDSVLLLGQLSEVNGVEQSLHSKRILKE